MKKVLVGLVALVAFSSTSMADDAYDRLYESFYQERLLPSKYYRLDSELGRVYRRLRRAVGSRGKWRLIHSERNWIHERNHNCADPYRNTVDIGCAMRMTRERLYFLEDWLDRLY